MPKQSKGKAFARNVLKAADYTAKGIMGARKVHDAYKSVFGKRNPKYVRPKYKDLPYAKSGKRKFATSGSFKGDFSTRGKVDPNWYAKRGSVFKHESGGVVSSSQCVYIGHTCLPQKEIIMSAIRALVKELWRQTGTTIVDWKEASKIGVSAMGIAYSYYDTYKGTTQLEKYLTVASAAPYDSIAEQIYTSFQTEFLGAEPKEFVQIRLYQIPAPSDNIASIQLKGTMMHFNTSSHLTLQNRTLAGTITGTTDDDGNRNSVSNNPVYGKNWTVKGNTLVPTVRSGTWAGAVANTGSGIISFSFSVDANNLSKPPPASFFKNARNSGNQRLEPGNIKKSSVYWKKSVSWNEFVYFMARSFDTDTIRPNLKYGETRLFGFEKLLDSREDEQLVSIGWEVNNKFECAGTFKKTVESVPILDIQ